MKQLRFAQIIILIIFLINSTFILAQNTSNGMVRRQNTTQNNRNNGTKQAKSAWDRKNYQTITHKNFRNQTVFNKSIDTENMDFPLINAAIFYVTNEIRSKNNLTPLEYAPELEIMAFHHAKAMLEQGFFSHQNPKTSNRRTTSDRAKLAGIANPAIAENIAMKGGFGEDTYLKLAESFLEQWMSSKGHRENILSTSANALGCGLMLRGDSVYAVQCFQWFKKIQNSGKAIDKLPE
ncbi:MAG: CAP domain-containing protein [Microscillaceae bacterium]|nr:CAP domain-containing protein [Microscillaceae bacterium]MDW8461621.1 CAP domain-containing protein [Cytophagales bacterium]